MQSLSVLLLQALENKDKELIEYCLLKQSKEVITETVLKFKKDKINILL
jgi:hypothetical protein